MISALHLLWIVPVAGAIGYISCSVLTANERSE